MDLIINSTFETPSVRFIESNGDFYIKGRVIPDKDNVFWSNVNLWVSENVAKMDRSIQLNIELDYINAYSISELINLISSINSFVKMEHTFSVNWISEEEDENEIHLIGQDIASTLGFTFTFLINEIKRG